MITRNFKRLLFLISMFTYLSISPACKSKPKDADIKKDVEKALNADVRTAGVAVEVTDGVATISGEVADESSRSAAATTATGVKGVKSVNNNVMVAQAPVTITPDDPLSTAVRDATKDFPGATATVNDGVITVTGELKADDWQRLKMSLDGLRPKKVDASGLKISK